MSTEEMNMAKALGFMKEHLSEIEGEIAAFEERAAIDADFPVITAHGWCVVTDSLAILIDRSGGGMSTPVHIEPHLCGFTCMSKKDAEEVAAMRNTAYRHHARDSLRIACSPPPWKVVMHSKIAARRAAHLRELKAGLEEAVRDTEARLAAKGSKA